MKAWHGRFGWLTECLLLPPDPAPDQTKYLDYGVNVSVSNSADVVEDGWAGSTPTHAENHSVLNDVSSVTMSIDRHSGAATFSDCVETREEYQTGGGTSRDPQLLFGDVYCITAGRYRSWKEILTHLTAGCSNAFPTEAEPIRRGCIWSTVVCTGGIEFHGGTKEDIEAFYTVDEERHFGDGTNYTFDETTVYSCTVTLTNETIDLHIVADYHLRQAFDLATDYPSLQTSDSSSDVRATITLSTPYTNTDVNADVDELLGQRDLLTDPYNPWTNSWSFPLVKRDETPPRAPSYGRDFFDSVYFETHGPCELLEPCAIAGNCPTGAILNYGGSSTLNSSPHLIGAYKEYYSGYVVACKYAEKLLLGPSHNWFRPCGADRFLIDLNLDQRYSNTWPICGRISVAETTQNGLLVLVRLNDSAPGLLANDKVDFLNVGTLGVNMNVETIIDDRHFVVTGTAGHYGGGGFVSNHGAPDRVWNDSSPKGDFQILSYAFNAREIAVNPSLRLHNDCYLSRAVNRLEITQSNLPPVPSSAIYVYPEQPFPDVCDERFSYPYPQVMSYVKVHQQMPDPTDSEGLVEARNTVPIGAPLLQQVHGGHCRADSSVPCAFIHVLNLNEITALASLTVGGVCPEPTGLIVPP